MNDIRKRLGYNVTRLRRLKGWTQIRLADKVEISATFMMHIEHGTRGASLETVELLAKALDVDICDLFMKYPEPVETITGKREQDYRLVSDLINKISITVVDSFNSYRGNDL
jgi:transcriptional regulator with XRE-family HTH domain